MVDPAAWPSDEQVIELGPSIDFYRAGKASQRVVLFEVLDRALNKQIVLNYEDSDKSLEHILPQDSTAAAWEELTDEERLQVETKFLDCLGNIAMVGPSDNSRLGVKRFPEKQAIYGTIAYPSTRTLVEIEGVETWGPSQIQTRAVTMLTTLCSTWERPTATVPADDRRAREFSNDDDANVEHVSYTSAADEAETGLLLDADEPELSMP